MKKYFLFLLFCVVAQTHATEFVLKPELKKDTVLFESDAKLEFIEGKTNAIEGSFEFNLENPKDSLYGIIQVDLNTLKTSIATRDKDMKEKYLETEKYQYAYFEILSADSLPNSFVSDSVYTVSADGYFYLHGVKNRIKPKLTIMVPSNSQNKQIDVTAKFHVLLEDYGIERPKLVILKVAKQINLEVKFSAFIGETQKKIVIPPLYKK